MNIMKTTLFFIFATLLILQVANCADSEQECEPGSTFQRGCNSCHCSPTGVAVCTKKGCLTAPDAAEVN
ncbi:hypothetical protein J437_LFUL006833 [Ladona fulva]|uniref:Pacifastin domain-containing protein n=1 Tax=Ladona fulva TaxID=123851 RepID=A0A8K0KAJ0_LADFU|nr:hypothetical protein J437_LFUL006833 [Ladona fulva]